MNLHHPLAEAAAGEPAGVVERYLPGIHFFDDTAACIGELDAVVAVDSAVANLAAMMAKPTCVPVNTSGDWRWGHVGRASTWVEGTTVLRQTQEGGRRLACRGAGCNGVASRAVILLTASRHARNGAVSPL